MRIVRIELTNIKSYREATIDLQRGVTAIRGHNGAGKSTLLEAIGWALFDFLPYKQDSFVREGASHGKVTVRFISPKDNRVYDAVRRCGSGATWFIVDPETGLRFESSADIHAFLREQLWLDSTVSLKDLFISAIGVPQGALTADFLLTAANRKKRFDALLQVEDYGVAVTNLKDTVSHLVQRRAVQENEILGLERAVAALEDARARLIEARGAHRALEETRDRLEEEARDLERRRQSLNEARNEVTTREAAATTAAARLDAARQREERAAQLLDESRLAHEALTAARPGRDRYLKAERERAAATERQRDRDGLRQRDADAAKSQAIAGANQRNAAGRLKEIEDAERKIVALQDDLIQQERLERARDDARQGVDRLAAIARDRAALAKRMEKQGATIRDREREVAKIEGARPEAEARQARQDQVNKLRAGIATRKQSEQRLTGIAGERARNDARRDQAARVIARCEVAVTERETLRPLVEWLPALEAEERDARDARDGARARLEQTRRSREQAGAGNCPFLAEPCLNIQKRGENNLRDWFDKRVAQEELALAPLEQALSDAIAITKDAREKKSRFDQLESARERLEQARADLDECGAATTRMDAEQAELTAALAKAGTPADLDAAERLLNASVEADRRLAGLENLTRELDDIRARNAADSGDDDRLKAEAAALAAAPAALESATAALAKLGDPRGRIAVLAARAAERETTEDALAAALAALTALEATRAGLAEALAPYAELDAEITHLDETIAATRADHATYMRNEQAAGQIKARAQERSAAADEAAEAVRAEASARQALEQARARFDPDALAAANARFEALTEERGQTREAIRGLEERAAALEETLRAGQVQIAALDAARVERDELAAEEAMLQQFRKLVGEAGPQVTRALLSQISQQANTIFGDIIGDRAGVLAWENDYEITLKRDGATRTFAQLSGGEQMTAALAVRLALLRRLTRLDMAFFDEPTQNMDGERRTALAEQLRRVRGFEQLIVISHDDTFEQGLDAVIHLEKRDGATCIASGEEVYASAAPLAGGLSAGRGEMNGHSDAGAVALG